MIAPEIAPAPVAAEEVIPPRWQPDRTAILYLLALKWTGRHVYAGTVPAHVKARRRAANRVAKASRKANRP